MMDLIKLEDIGGIKKVDGKEIHKKAVTDLTKPVKRPPIAISIGVDDYAYKGEKFPLRFGTFGNISLIKGEEKSRKSFAKSLLIACSIGGNANNFSENIRGHFGTKLIIDIDTEQGEYDAWLNAKRIPEMVGKIPSNYIHVQLREYTKDDRMGYLKWLFEESDLRYNLGMVFMDGYVDFVKDFNNQSESDEFTESLMRWSKLTNCHISGILHVNPGAEKGRGHLGTILQQKCETVVMIKSNGDTSEFIRQRGRGKGFRDFEFGVDTNWLPYEIENEGLI